MARIVVLGWRERMVVRVVLRASEEMSARTRRVQPSLAKDVAVALPMPEL